MSPDKPQVLALIYTCIDELNAMGGKKAQKLEKSPQTLLLHDGGGLDSLGFVNFVSLVEEKCEEQFGKSLVLTQTSPQVSSGDPFETIGSLADHIETLLKH